MIPRYLEFIVATSVVALLLSIPNPHTPLHLPSAVRAKDTLSHSVTRAIETASSALTQYSISPHQKTRVIFDMDGNVDDFISLFLLLARPDIEVAAVIVLSADCEGEPALSATRKILRLTGNSHIPAALSTLGAVNPFPRDWRTQAFKVDALPIFNQGNMNDTIWPAESAMSGEELLRYMLFDPKFPPASIVATGPLTNIAWAFKGQSAERIAKQVREIYWMGGALRVPGNVYFNRTDSDHDFVKHPLTEWNAYWDPPAVADVFGAGVTPSQPEPFPITIFPLDVTNSVPITPEFLMSFGQQYQYLYSAAAGATWALVGGYNFRWGFPYYAWDSLTVACFASPNLCKYAQDRVEAVSHGWQEGRTIVDADIQNKDPVRVVRVATQTNQIEFEEFVRSALRR